MAEQLHYSLRVALLVDRLARLTRELQYVAGLNPAQWEALRYLASANRYSRSPGAVAQFLGATKGTTSQTLITLESKGLIERSPCRGDRRQVDLALTPAGQALVADDPIAGVELVARDLDDEMGAGLVKGLSRLLHDLQHRLGVKEFGVCENCTLFCVKDAAGAGAESHRCGLTGEQLNDDEPKLRCVEFRGAA